MREVDFVIPAYNEADNLKDLTGDIVECFERIGVTNFKILLVENGSDDKSSDLIKKLNTQDERITGIVLSRNFGPQGAIHAGLCHTNAVGLHYGRRPAGSPQRCKYASLI